MKFHPPARPRLEGEVAWGVHLSLLCPELVELCGLIGFSWLLLDGEHTPLDRKSVRELARAADVVGLFCLVRVPKVEASIIEGFLDAGAGGILAPHINTAEEAQALVAAVKFAPQGTRGSAPRVRAAHYGLRFSPAEYCKRANQATMVAALLETPQGIEKLEAIAAVPGIDCLAIGPNDLGLSMGIDSGVDDPRVRDIVARAQARIAASGTPQLAVATSADQALSAVAAGARMVAISDAAMLVGAGRSFLEQVDSTRAQPCA